jgi:hypothetical protein
MEPKEVVCTQCNGTCQCNGVPCVYCNAYGVVLQYPNGIKTQYPPKIRERIE